VALGTDKKEQNPRLFCKKKITIDKCCELHRLSYPESPLNWPEINLFIPPFQATAKRMASTPKYVAVVAIDFGTTYSGFAFSFHDKRGEGGIHMNREWGNDEGRSTLKAPSSILLRPNKEFDSFGYEADDKYVHFRDGEEKEYYYLKHFKMELHKSKVTNIVGVVVVCNICRQVKLKAKYEASGPSGRCLSPGFCSMK